MSLEANKVFAAILLAGLIGMFSGFIAEILVSPHAETETALEIEGVGEKPDTGSSEPDPVQPILGMLAEADASAGESTFNQCSACHTIEQGGSHGVGPNLYNVLGAPIGGKDGFNYSSALQNAEGEWTYEAMNKWLQNPNRYISGNNMGFGGLSDPEARANVIAYMRQFADNPPELPSQDEIDARMAEYEEAMSDNGEGSGEDGGGESSEDGGDGEESGSDSASGGDE